MKVGRQVERWQSPDGKHVLRLFIRGADRFYFVELSELAEQGEPFWAITRTSEEHASLEAARDAALQLLPWLREAMQARA